MYSLIVILALATQTSTLTVPFNNAEACEKAKGIMLAETSKQLPPHRKIITCVPTGELSKESGK